MYLLRVKFLNVEESSTFQFSNEVQRKALFNALRQAMKLKEIYYGDTIIVDAREIRMIEIL